MKTQGVILALLLAANSNGLFAQTTDLRGFSSKSSVLQRTLEERFDQQLNAANIGRTIKELSAKPHHLGSEQGKIVAETILKRFKDYGWLDSKIERYEVLFPTPKTRVLTLTEPIQFTASLKEPAYADDASSGQSGQLPAYNAWGADGDVTGELIYVNFGLPEDYDRLEKLGLNVSGKIVIARYGRSWRGLKPKLAYERGAIGCIIYSDPKEDGYYKGDVYPAGPFKNENAAQRGSVLDVMVQPGDPLTPGIAATQTAERILKEDAQSILKIPVLPISYHDALPLLSALDGPVAPESWRGALPITYHIGAGRAKVHLKVASNWNRVSAYNVIAKIKGTVYPDQWVVRGNHHDAWVNGAADPVSGLAALLEEAKAIGALLKTGYKPKRTLVYCAWDGEEPGLLGSTEWVEDHADELSRKAVAYINTDGNGRGFLKAGGAQQLASLVTDIAQEVPDPQTQVSVLERRKSHDLVTGTTLKLKKERFDLNKFPLDALGTGSDYSPFFQHLGIPSLNFEFEGEDEGGEYHTNFDSYEDYVRFKDRNFDYGITLAKVTGRTLLRLAEADVLPFEYADLHVALKGYVQELIKLGDDLRESNAQENRLINEGKYQQAADPLTVFYVPRNKPVVPELDFANLDKAIAALGKSVENVSLRATKALQDKKERAGLSEILYQAERQLLLTAGLPQRPWYKHSLYAPGLHTGYSVKTLPGIREAIEQGDWFEVTKQVDLTAERIQQLAVFLATGLGTK
ncbi:transferrin receptor-like dimerization domain-containing protein [Pedobacter sp. MC2016-24]|uniref:transferrin receptor-like dimerization domain-containing protein n=1 Tax=Pedobacter sp. MC2016-24 TaxID=2780090 RepID=UPI0018823F47|nr:transferrin receptor-like dimerization domain-containing protein [Pedobacter sp. MC2016-24]MBE9598308.1 M28 family peptidase [Pedobacter sp. MC2016-24]